MSKSKLSNLLKGKSVPNLSSYTSPWNKNDEKLWNAIKQQNVKQVKSVLSKTSVTTTKLGPQGKSVFHLACEIGNEQIVDAILASTQDVNDTTIQGVTALQRAAAKGHTSTVNKLLKKQANVDQRDCDSMTALHHACFGQHQDCVKALLLKNADVNSVEQGGKTPLFYSAHQGHLDICRWLLDRGADINCQDKDNTTPLILAAKEGHKNVCELLLRKGANPDLTDRYGKTALEHAVSSKHLELQEVFAKLHKQVHELSQHRGSVSLSESGSFQSDVPTRKSSLADGVPESYKHYTRSVPYESDDESVSHTDAHSIHSMDDNLLSNRQHSPMFPTPSIPQRVEQAYRVDETVPKSVDIIEGGETVPKSVYSKEGGETVPKSVYSKEVKRLQDQLEGQRKMLEAYKLQEQTLKKQIAADGDNPLINNTSKKEILGPQHESDHLIIGLNQQIAELREENERLKAAMIVSSDSSEVSSDGFSYSQLQMKTLLLEKDQLEKQITQMKEQLDKQHSESNVDHHDVILQNKLLTKEVELLRQSVASLREELDVATNETTIDAQRLDAVLAASGNFEEVNFDEEGFVEGRDMTKEEFFQAQNQELRAHCGRLTEELEKLRSTFNAILKAGDNLQSDYDHLATEKDVLQYELETTIKEKIDVIAENEFLLTDNNELHENLKKIVHELEKMQEKYQTTLSENEELKRRIKVGEVPRLLEERAVLQQKCVDLESTSQRLQHDHNILLEEVQSLNESLNQMTIQRNQLTADLEELEPICHQHEALQVEYNQLEMEFAELLRDKQALELQISNNNEVNGENDDLKVPDVSSLEKAMKQLTAEKQQLEKDKQDLEDVISGLSRHIVTTEHKVKDLENNLEQVTASSVSHSLERNGVKDDENTKSNEHQKHQEEIMNLKKQITQLTQEVEEWEKKHADTVTTYRTHLLSAVQGHMDPDVKDALYHIIELRSMEQFC